MTTQGEPACHRPKRRPQPEERSHAAADPRRVRAWRPARRTRASGVPPQVTVVLKELHGLGARRQGRATIAGARAPQ
eukprot:7379901-Prymnesium_polylepis.1